MPKVSVGRAELDTRPHFLYRFYDRTGVLLYIGITVDFPERQKHHAKYKEWWPQVDQDATKVDYYNGRRAALDAERAAIKKDRPLENDQHNEWVEVEAEEAAADEALELAHEILGDLDDEFRKDLVDGCATDWTGATVSDRERDISAAGMAAFKVRTMFRDLLYDLDQLLDLVPEGRGEHYRDIARSQLPAGASDEAAWWDTSFIPAAIDAWLFDEANRLLQAMHPEEAAEWRQNVKAKSLGPSKKTILAARYASIWRQHGQHFAGNCLGPGRHGARCPNKVDTLAFFELCTKCPAGEACAGHERWCRVHAELAQRGDLRMIQDDPFDVVIRPILRIVDLSETTKAPF